jgi:hypothetical protein
MNTKLKQIYSIFSPTPLQPEQKDLYVDLEEVRGHSSIVQRLGQKIRLAEKPTCQVLTGHRGSGKSTELARLRQALENPSDGDAPFFVVLMKADDELDRNDVDFPEVLIALVRQVAEQLRTRADIELKPGYFKDRWERLKSLLKSEISFDKVELSATFAKLSATIKNSPEARKQVREALEPDTNNWLLAANDILGEAIRQLEKKGFRGLVIIVDDLDKMITRPHESAGCSTTEYLFVHRSQQLRAFQCHLIYTLPIELAYSHLESTIKQLYGGHLPVVPMTKLLSRPPELKTFAAGVEKFRQIIAARLQSIGATESELFSNNRTRDELIELTGGQPTELMSMVREALVTEGLPIGTSGVKRCRIEAMRSYRRQLRSDHWPLIVEARRTGGVVRTLANDLAFRELLDSRALLLYVNDEEWYAVNPAISDLRPPTEIVPGEAAS